MKIEKPAFLGIVDLFRLKQLNPQTAIWLTPYRRKLAENLFWLTADKGLQIFHGFFVAALVANYLGPGKYGILAFAGSLLAILTPLTTLGFDSVVVREFVKQSDRSKLFWTVVFSRVAIGLLSYFLLWTLVAWGVVPSESQVEASVLIIGCLPLTTIAFDVPRLLFQAEIREKWIVWITNSILVITAIIKVCMVEFDFGIESFAIINAATVMGTVLVTSVLAKILKLLPTFHLPDAHTFLTLLRESWPLILSGLSIALYMNVDIVMLRVMTNPEVVGIYTVAARLSGFWFFIPLALGNTLFPGLTKAHAAGRKEYSVAMYRYLRLNTLGAYATLLVAEILVPPLIYLLFGDQYYRSVPCFRLHAIAIMFVFLGVARSQHLNLEKAHLYQMWATLIGVATNLTLNYVMIPIWAEYGAALATVLSYATSAWIMSFVFRPTRGFAKLQLRTLEKPWKGESGIEL
ncbi:flippase [Rhodopirellula sp. MGV]|uniref:flippase n=1 Tax=Rhodopirellula sp. MGV TaxID=2023130 RepID=UPI000B9615B6|nr:flippase [Rhodopirellula sp. MGV]OYP37314.1 hypothetical protein CGZ80_05420 [Rhodopirellula sp. MGV]PNY36404.1 flippase [Rhodopirellula baltica]